MNIALAGCVLLDPQGRVLLLHRATPSLTQWELPGGKVEVGETPATAAVREISEELGVDVTITKDLGSQNFEHKSDILHYTWFLATITSGEPTPTEAKFDDVRYFDWADLPARTDLSANILNLIAAYPQGITSE